MTGRVVVIGLGPGDAGLLTAQAQRAIERIPTRFVRTTRHPSAAAVSPAVAFDDVYESAADFDQVYSTIVERLVEAADRHGEILYAVPGSPVVAERSVELLRADDRIELDVQPALSFLDLAWARLGIDPIAAGVRLVDGHRFAVEAAGQTGPLLVAQCDRRLVLSDIKLAVEEDPGRVVFLQRLGLADETVTEVAWADLDRSVEPDHLTCLWIPQLAAPVAAQAAGLVELMRVLREQCPWDREQTHQSLTRHLIEEAYEVLDAIAGLPALGAPAEDPEPWDHLQEELGDLLFQVVFHARLASEAGWFDFADVARGIHDKLVGRHPHVFGDAGPTTIDELRGTWEQAKLAEKGRASVMDGIPAALPSLLYAAKVQRKATGLGLDWSDAGAVWPVLDSELAELRQAIVVGAPDAVAAEAGDVLFSVVNLLRKLDVEAETALREAATRFGRRVSTLEALAADAGLTPSELSAAALDELWQQAKAQSS